jgi:hypothetical protein
MGDILKFTHMYELGLGKVSVYRDSADDFQLLSQTLYALSVVCYHVAMDSVSSLLVLK